MRSIETGTHEFLQAKIPALQPLLGQRKRARRIDSGQWFKAVANARDHPGFSGAFSEQATQISLAHRGEVHREHEEMRARASPKRSQNPTERSGVRRSVRDHDAAIVRLQTGRRWAGEKYLSGSKVAQQSQLPPPERLAIDLEDRFITAHPAGSPSGEENGAEIDAHWTTGRGASARGGLRFSREPAVAQNLRAQAAPFRERFLRTGCKSAVHPEAGFAVRTAPETNSLHGKFLADERV